MTVATFVYQRGAPIRVDLVDDNDAFVGKTLVSKIKRAIGRSAPPKDTAALATGDVSYVPAVGDAAGYWTIEFGETTDWKPGFYVVDAVISDGATVLVVTESVLIELREAVTP